MLLGTVLVAGTIALYTLIADGQLQWWDIMGFIGCCTVGTAVIAFVAWLCSRFKAVRAVVLTVVGLCMVAALVYGWVLMPIQNIMKNQELTIDQALPIYGKGAAVIAVCIAVIIGIIFLLVKYVPRLRNTFLGKWLDWVLNHACPHFGINPSVVPPEKPKICARCGQAMPTTEETKAE